MALPFEIEGPYKNTQADSQDTFWYGGGSFAYADLATAKGFIPSVKRKGLTIGVIVSGKVVEYYWPNPSAIADTDLIIKYQLPQPLGTGDSPTFNGITLNGTQPLNLTISGASGGGVINTLVTNMPNGTAQVVYSSKVTNVDGKTLTQNILSGGLLTGQNDTTVSVYFPTMHGSNSYETLASLSDIAIAGANYLPLAGGVSMTGFFNLAGDPTSSMQAATMNYVDTSIAAIAQGVVVIECDLVATTNITLSGEQTIDGVLTNNTRVLLTGQTTASQNGPYVSSPTGWTRTSDANTGTKIAKLDVVIKFGTANAVTEWLNTNASVTLGTTNITFAKISGGTVPYTGGTGITVTSNVIALDLTRVATTSITGLLSSTDWNTFSGKVGSVASANADIAVAGTTTRTLTLNSDTAGSNNTIVKRDASGGITGTSHISAGATPILRFNETGAATNSKVWDIAPSSGILNFTLWNDAISSGNNWLTVTRSTNASATATFNSNVNSLVSFTAPVIAGGSSGTLILKTLNSSTLTTALTVAADQSITIGSATPTLKFQANGDTTSGTFTRTVTGNLLSLTNQTIGVAGPGNALAFTSAGNKYFTAPFSGLPTGAITMSFETWVKRNGSNTYLLNYGSNAGGSGNYMIIYANATELRIYNGGGDSVFSTSAFALNTWVNVLCVFSSGNLKVYINSSLIANVTSTWNISSTSVFANYTLGGSTGDGVFDQYVIWNTALTATDAVNIYNGGSGTASLPGTPLIRFDMDEGSPATTLVNTGSLGSSNNATTFNSPIWQGIGNGKVPTAGSSSPVLSTLFSHTNGVGTSSNSSFMIGDNQTELTIQSLRLGLLSSDGGIGFVINSNGVLIDQSNTTIQTLVDSQLKLGSGIAAAGGSALKLTSGTDLTTTEAGALEYNGARLALTTSAGRRRFLLGTDAAPTNGQIPIGNGTDFAFATLTAGSGITITNASGSITLAATLITTVDVTGTTQQAVTNTQYIADNAALCTITLPTNANSSLGDVVVILGRGAGGWKLAQNASDMIHGATDTTSGITGYVASQTRYDCVAVRKIGANEWTITSNRGTLTIA